MNITNFCYWLQGYFEITNVSNIEISKSRLKIIKDHIKIVEEERDVSKCAKDFFYEFKGFLNFSNKESLNSEETKNTTEKLQSVFNKITPNSTVEDLLDEMEKSQKQEINELDDLIYGPGVIMDCHCDTAVC